MQHFGMDTIYRVHTKILGPSWNKYPLLPAISFRYDILRKRGGVAFIGSAQNTTYRVQLSPHTMSKLTHKQLENRLAALHLASLELVKEISLDSLLGTDCPVSL